MPRNRSRINLQVVGVRVERLHEISPLDALNEGWNCTDEERVLCHGGSQESVLWFADLWDSINKARGFGWDVNPWVWVVTFEPAD